MASGTIKSVVPRSDIVNNLTTNDSTKVLSAAQGKALNDKITQKYITGADKSAFETALITYLNSLDNYGQHPVYAGVTSAVSPYMKGGTTYEGILFKNSNNHGELVLYHHSNPAVSIKIQNGTCVWDNFATYNNSYVLSGGIPIPENANIDNYTTPGRYGTASSVTARTMYGLPYERGSTSNYAFNLIVENSAFNDQNTRRQTLQFYNSNTKWTRYGTTSAWTTAWKDEIATLNDNLANMEFKSKNATLANNAEISITCTCLFVVSVKNATNDQIMGDMCYCSYLTAWRVFNITNNGSFTISYSDGVATIKNMAGMYQSFMILYK